MVEVSLLFLSNHDIALSELAQDDPDAVVAAIKTKIEELRKHGVGEDAAIALAFPLGYLYGEQLRKVVGWDWSYVTQDKGFESYGVVSPDKAFVCYTIKCVHDLLLDSAKENSSRLLFNMIKAGKIPQGQPGQYRALSF